MPPPRDQDILKAFDYDTTDDDPYLTVSEVTDGLANHFDIHVATDTVRAQLDQMVKDGTVARHTFGSSVAYRALFAPELSDEVKAKLNARENETEAGETVSYEGLWKRLDSRD